MDKITIKNLTTCEVGLRVPEIRLNRTIKKNESIKISKELFEEALTYPGIQPMIDQKIIGIVEQEARVDFGFEWDEDTSYSTEDLANEKEIRDILISGSDFSVKKLCQNASLGRKEDIAKIAFSVPSLSVSRIELISELTNIDILAGIKATKDLEKE